MDHRLCRIHLILALLGIFLCSCSSNDSKEELIAQVLEEISWLESTHEYGHTGIKIQTDELVIYLDPVDLVSIDELPYADIILITHNHEDHFSPATIGALATNNTKIVSLSLVTQSIFNLETIAIEPGISANVAGLEIEGIAAYNASHSESLGYLGFIFSIDGVRIYCSGDTSLNDEILGLTNIDIAVLNIRNPYSLTGAEAVEFAETVEPAVIIPIHWMPEDDTYQDAQEIEYIQQNIPDSVSLEILELN